MNFTKSTMADPSRNTGGTRCFSPRPGNTAMMKGFAAQCMAEYDLDGWTVPDLTDSGDLGYRASRPVR